jgi:DNA polymerase-3 subunit delta
MYQREFNQLLKSNIPKALFMYGDDEYLIDYYIDFYIKKLDAKESMLRLYYDDYDFAQAKNFLAQTSLFGGTNLLLIKGDKKIPKNELSTLVELANRDSNNYFIFAFDGDAKGAKAIQSSFSEKTGGVWVRFFEPNMRDALSLLKQKADEISLDIDNYALSHLVLMMNNNLSLCVNELDKLAILESKITTKDIDRLVYSTAPMAVETLLIDMFNKKQIIPTISKLLELGEDEFSLLRALEFFINQIFLFHTYIKLNGRVNSAEILGYKLPKHIEEQKASLAIKITTPTLMRLHEELLKGEIEIKKAPAIQREALIYGLFIRIQQIL